jgi:GAF domain
MRVQRRPLLTDIQGYVRAHWQQIIVPILLALASGPLGLLGISLWSTAARSIPWSLAPVISLVSFVFVIVVSLWLRERGLVTQSDGALTVANGALTVANGALTVANRVISSDETLLRLLPGLVNNTDRERAARGLAREYLQDARHVFQENVARASILRPSQDEPEYLVTWAWYQMPQESRTRTRFYIGPDEGRKRGIAGKAYVMREVQVIHFTQGVSGHWEPDDPDYQVFDNTQTDPLYRSFVAVPILGAEYDCLGVLCFDSPSPTAFDSEGIQDLLLALGTRIAAVIRMSKPLATARKTRQTRQTQQTRRTPGIAST